jgi:DUF1009 family protein
MADTSSHAARAAIGLVAGRGEYPLLFCRQARAAGVGRIVVCAFHGETDESIDQLADEVNWVYVGQVNKCIKTFTKAGVSELVFAGQIKPGRLFEGLRPDLRAVKLLAKMKAKNADTIFGTLVSEFGTDGLTVLPATTYLDACLAQPGQMGRVKPGKSVLADIELGRRIAREVSALDIGQTVVVKDGVILAVEAFEGTDKAILRGGELSRGGGITVVKVAKPGQDMRFDVPCVGLRTVESLTTAGAVGLALHAGKTLFIEDGVQAALDAAKIATVGIELDG